MKVGAVTSRDLCDSKVQHEIPAFVRPFVWIEEDQWAPLCSDVPKIAENLLSAGEDGDEREKVTLHFPSRRGH
jgi:hypothetical protein